MSGSVDIQEYGLQWIEVDEAHLPAAAINGECSMAEVTRAVTGWLAKHGKLACSKACLSLSKLVAGRAALVC